MGFCSLQHLKNPRSTARGLCPPATFRLQGLATLLTAYSLESRAGFVSHRQRSWDSPFGGFPFLTASKAFRPRTNPPTVSPAVFPPPKRQTGPTGLGYWVHAARKCLTIARGFNPTTAGASPGVRPSRACRKGLGPDFSGPPLTRFAGSDGCPPNPPAPQSIDRPLLHPARHAPECTPAEATLVGFTHLPDPAHSDPPAPGLLSSPRVGSHIAADSPTIFGHRLNPAEAAQDRSWVPSIVRVSTT
jgi:hypothetical protein